MGMVVLSLEFITAFYKRYTPPTKPLGSQNINSYAIALQDSWKQKAHVRTPSVKALLDSSQIFLYHSDIERITITVDRGPLKSVPWHGNELAP